MLDKWAVHLGGGLTHRLNKDDATMIKENDLAVTGESGMQAIVQLLSTIDVNDYVAPSLNWKLPTKKMPSLPASTWKQRQEGDSIASITCPHVGQLWSRTKQGDGW